MAAPTRTKLLIEMEDPMLAKSSTDTDAPSRASPKRDRVDPRVTKPLTDMLLPMHVHVPSILTPAPNLTQPPIASDAPKLTKSSTDTVEAMRLKLRSDRDAP